MAVQEKKGRNFLLRPFKLTSFKVSAMSTWFVSRHPGAISWAKEKNLAVDFWATHLDVNQIKSGDIVIGVLPMPAAALVCAKGARFIALKIQLPENLRGKELTAQTLDCLNCTLAEYRVCHVKDFAADAFLNRK